MISVDEHLPCLHFVGHAGGDWPTTAQDASDVWVVRWVGVATQVVCYLLLDLLLYEVHEFAHCNMLMLS